MRDFVSRLNATLAPEACAPQSTVTLSTRCGCFRQYYELKAHSGVGVSVPRRDLGVVLAVLEAWSRATLSLILVLFGSFGFVWVGRER